MSRATANGHTLVRWRDVAAWSGVGLRSNSQWHDVALPQDRPSEPPPWDGVPPEEGNLEEADLRALVDVLRGWTTTAARWWFAIWDGYGWDDWELIEWPDGQPRPMYGPASVDKPVPDEVLAGPRVKHPGRTYLLYSGAPGDALVFVNIENQSPNLWWPEDRSWCVATELDLHYTYIGGSTDLIHRLVTHPGFEAQEVSAEQSFRLRAPDWVQQRAANAVDELIDNGRVTLALWAGTVQARLSHDDWGGGPQLTIEIETTAAGGGGTSRHPLDAPNTDASRRELARDLARGILDLVV
ncbi:MAG TPA: hypothetical protein VFJ14_08190 [Nocardioidaceae bacterium]|nr:hypothetical protein [Nocardioidaceae bacterium]